MVSGENVGFTWKHFLPSCDFFFPYFLEKKVSQHPVLSFSGVSHLLSAVDKKIMILFYPLIKKERKYQSE